MGVGVAPDVDEKGRVVDHRPLLVIQPGQLGEPQCDQTLTQHVLHWLTKAEVDPQRQGREQLGQANVRSIWVRLHAWSVTPNWGDLVRRIQTTSLGIGQVIPVWMARAPRSTPFWPPLSARLSCRQSCRAQLKRPGTNWNYRTVPHVLQCGDR